MDEAPEIATFRDAVDFIERGLNYERTPNWQYRRKWLDLRRTRGLLAFLGDPHRAYRIVHVAGTKGKGTTAGALAHCLHRCGRRTGLLTSPHLITHRERICVDGRMIGEEAFTDAVRRIRPHVEAERRAGGDDEHRAPTYFEMLTAMAFDHFARSGVGWAVVEVGLGGRLDSTNVVEPRCCVITTIGFDHTDKLGDTPQAIAGEKGGILKPGVPVVIGRQAHTGALETLRRMADERDCERWEVGRDVVVADAAPLAAPSNRPDAPLGWRFGVRTPLRRYDDLFTPLLGSHQVDNLATALGALDMLRRDDALELDPETVGRALADFRVAGRIELLQREPMLVLDVAHTAESVQALLDALDVHLPGRRLHVVFGCSADKNAEAMLGALGARCASMTVTQARLSRARPAQEVAEIARRTQPRVHVVADAWQAAQAALSQAGPQDVVCVTGSFFVAGEVRAAWLAR